MELTSRHREYWHKNLTITAILLFIWFVVTFVVGSTRAISRSSSSAGRSLSRWAGRAR